MDPDLLSFSGPEVAEMFDRVGISVTEDEAEGMVSATSGWALAILHHVGAGRTRGSSAAYDPRDRSLAERIERTVMRRLPRDLAPVVSDLAVVGPATRSQFELVTDRRDATDLLERLRRRHLVRQRAERWSVVVPIRSHLRIERERTDAASATVLRRRMARTLATDGDARSALDMLATAGDHQARARLLLERHRQWSGAGDHVVVEHAAEALQHDPSLVEMHLVLAWYAVLNAADSAEASAHVAAVERIPLTGVREIRAHSETEFLHAMVARREGRLADAADHAKAGRDIGAHLDAASLPEQSQWPYVAVTPTATPLYLGHSLFHGGEIDEARAEVLHASTSRPWSPPALAAIHGVLGVIGWLEDDPSARIHGVIAASHLGPRLNASNHLAAAALILTTTGPDAVALAERYRREVPRMGEPTTDVFGHVVTALTGDAEAAGEHLAAARRVVDRCAQPGVLSLVVARASAQLAPSDQATTVGEALTDGERRVVLAFRGDLTEREIAAELHLSHNTVRTYRRRAYAKLGATSREDAVAKLAIRDGRSD